MTQELHAQKVQPATTASSFMILVFYCASTAVLTCCASPSDAALMHRLVLDSGIMDSEVSAVRENGCRHTIFVQSASPTC
jgi:hypothetical protein